jgi:hypothetical protein
MANCDDSGKRDDAMHCLRLLPATISLLLFCASATAAEGKLDTQTRVLLQAAMQTHIERTTVAGRYPKVELASGQVKQLYPAAGHPMVLRMGQYYVLCADFRDDAGKAVNVDFYLTEKAKGFSVFQVEIANRAPLEALVKAGAARMLD